MGDHGPRFYLGAVLLAMLHAAALVRMRRRRELRAEREHYIDVRSARVLDDFNTSGSEPLTARAGWGTTFDDPVVWVEPNLPLPEGAIPLTWEQEWMVDGRWYGVLIKDGVQTRWEKVDGLWTRLE